MSHGKAFLISLAVTVGVIAVVFRVPAIRSAVVGS